MSSRKKRSAPSCLQETYDAIKDLLLRVKDVKDLRTSLVDDLHQLAALAELFTEQRPRSTKSWIHLAESLDREGVSLWNTSSLIRQNPEGDGRTVIAALRLSGFRLMEAGLEPKPGIETLLHVLQTASKTGATLSEIGNNEAAASVLGCAAKFEELLRNMDDPQDFHHQAKARATIVYFSSRMEAAWREGNLGVADFMLQRITENDERLNQLPARDRELLAAKLLDIGKSMLRKSQSKVTSDGASALDAVKWLQKAFGLTEKLEDSATPGLGQLKNSILTSLARAYYLSSSHDPENLTRAEVALQELIASVDGQESSAYQELRWMRITILRRRQAGDSALLDAFTSMINHMKFVERDVNDVLREFKTLVHQHTLVTALLQHILHKALESANDSGLPFVDRLLLFLVFHCSKDEEHNRAIQDMNAAFKYTCQVEFQLPPVTAAACLTLIWQTGDRHYQGKRWSEAADWFLIGAHEVFGSISHIGSSKCHRKAALCYIQQREYARAATIIRRCPTNEATTHYVVMYSAVHQGLEDEAVVAVQSMVKAPDFDRSMLLLATQLSHESEMKSLLLVVLEALLNTLKTRDNSDMITEAITLNRCIIRLVSRLLAEPAANQPILINTLIKNFRTATSLVETALANQSLSIVAKDVSWLWRTAYNCAVQGCSQWEYFDDQISDLFDVSRVLLEAYCQATPVAVDTDVHVHIVDASFAAVSGRVFRTRRIGANSQNFETSRFREVLTDIKECKERICDIINSHKIPEGGDLLRVRSYVHILRVFEAEHLSELKEWGKIMQCIGDIINSDATAVNTFEAVADILWVQTDCPVDVLFAALEALLHASLDRNSLSIVKFSRWLRGTCTILLCRNTTADRVKAVGYVEQAITVMTEDNESRDELYPVDERQWLLATSYNTGIECLHASLLDEAKRWFEASTVICKFVPGGQDRAQKISDTYAHLLARYSPGS